MLLDQLERQTYEDALTGLANRRRLDQRLADEFALALRHGRPLAVAMADLDHFKTVNDRFSHAVGDAVLRAIAKLLSAQVRHTDLVARFGGEEFVIVLVETDAAAALRVCEKLRAAVANHAWTAIHPALALTMSIGVCADIIVAGARADAGDGRPQSLSRRRPRVATASSAEEPSALEAAVRPPLQLADEPDHHAEDFERALRDGSTG